MDDIDQKTLYDSRNKGLDVSESFSINSEKIKDEISSNLSSLNENSKVLLNPKRYTLLSYPEGESIVIIFLII